MNFPIYDYNDNKVKVFGTVKLNCFDRKHGVNNRSVFLVVENNREPILGLKTSVDFKLISRLDVDSVACLPQTKERFVELNRDVFQGLGKFPCKQSIVLRDDAEPTLHYKKRIPHSLLEPLERQLKQLVGEGVVTPVTYPTDWVNNLQIVEKANGKLRLCLDPKPLNRGIKREHFLIPTIDDFTSQMTNKRIFTVLDLSSGFWQMELDEKS